MVSVILPNYNHAPYLNRRIDSILNQTYSNFELILLDDCSTDNSLDIFYSYKNHPKISHIITNQKNSGSTFEQWNKGFELAKGEFVWIAESDDWCEPTLLENLILPLEKDESLVLSFCQSLLVTKDSKIIYKTENQFLEEKVSGRDFVVNKMFGDPVLVNAGMAVFRKSALKKVGDEHKRMRGAGDWMFWVQVALQGNVFISGKSLNYCFRHAATVTARSETTGQDMIEGNLVFDFVLKHAKPSPGETRNALKQRVSIYFAQRRKYLSKEIKTMSKNNLLALHPKVKREYRRFYIKRLLKIITNIVLKPFTN